MGELTDDEKSPSQPKGSGGMLPQESCGPLHLPRSILVHSESALAHKNL